MAGDYAILAFTAFRRDLKGHNVAEQGHGQLLVVAKWIHSDGAGSLCGSTISESKSTSYNLGPLKCIATARL